MATPPDAALSRIGQIKGAAATWGPGAAGVDADRALFLKLGSSEVLMAYEEACVFKGKTRERNIRGGKSVAFPVTGKLSARYLQPGKPVLGEGNAPSDLNEVVITLDSLMIADAVVYDLEALMAYYDVRSIYTTELGRALAYEFDKRVCRILYSAATKTTEPLAKQPLNKGRIGGTITLGTGYTGAGASRQAKGDAIVDAIFDARVQFEKKDVSIDGMYCCLTPEDYYCVTASSRAINADFAGGASNGTIADGRTLRVAGINIMASNHLQQPAYTLVAGDVNPDYQQDLSKCHGLIWNKEAAAVLTLLSPSLQITSGDFNIQYQSTLLLARQALGMGVLRPEAACAIVTA
jgi:hypothetical protein